MAYARPPGSSASQGPLQPGAIGFTVPPPAYAAENREMPSGPVQPGLQEVFPSPRASAPGFSPTIMAAPYPPAVQNAGCDCRARGHDPLLRHGDGFICFHVPSLEFLLINIISADAPSVQQQPVSIGFAAKNDRRSYRPE
ncbi:hypothetical protein HPB50_018816 [Hyalomma asiaticum]|uniref:Uncharacterized protein n=1 Tax=Hyalomma asiaticum TaxID=266040 RepID=A0ACB7SIP7_HYAAI|nr:hypothetical protein HPB50_018816 [Hyalomma asiaticum]